MSKRVASDLNGHSAALKSGHRPSGAEGGDGENIDFEDDFEDEFESEDELIEGGDDEVSVGSVDAEDLSQRVEKLTFIPGRHKLSPGEVLSPDLSAYEMLHELSVKWSCLSFDILPDQLGEGKARKIWPATLYAASGTQAPPGKEHENELMIMKLSNLSKMDSVDDDSDEDGEEGGDEHVEPILESKTIGVPSCTNRLRAHQLAQSSTTLQSNTVVATMMESGKVLLHDVTPQLAAFDIPGSVLTPEQRRPGHVIEQHGQAEGYAMDWDKSRSRRRLLTGDVRGKIFFTSQDNSGKWTTQLQPFVGHGDTVESLQWSPSEESVFSSAGNDGCVKIWDLRKKSRRPALSVHVSETDANAIAWSPHTTHLLASGHDDGSWAVWDLRSWRKDDSQRPLPVASFGFSKEQITSLEWHPTDNSVIAAAAGDNTVTLWDLAVELDDEDDMSPADPHENPAQLLFVHYMEKVKECHWHPHLPGVLMATGENGFNVFKTISV